MTNDEIEIFANITAGLVEGEVKRQIEPLHKEVAALRSDIAGLMAMSRPSAPALPDSARSAPPAPGTRFVGDLLARHYQTQARGWTAKLAAIPTVQVFGNQGKH